MTQEILIVVGAYLLGGLPTALLAVRLASGEDVRQTGSGNVGATNAGRAAGLRVGVFVSVIDVAKGVIPLRIMAEFNPASRWLAAAMVAAVIGHCFPVWLRFRGGKGVATAFGAFAALSLPSAALAFVVWLVVVGLTRFAALASLTAVVAYPVVMVFLARPPTELLVAVSLVAGIVVVRHRKNLQNLVRGVEPRIGDHPEEE